MDTVAFIVIGVVLAVFVLIVMLWSYRDRDDDSGWY